MRGAHEPGVEASDPLQGGEQIPGRVVGGKRGERELGVTLRHEGVAGEDHARRVQIGGVTAGVAGRVHGADGHVAEDEVGLRLVQQPLDDEVLVVHGHLGGCDIHLLDDVGRCPGLPEHRPQLFEESSAFSPLPEEVVTCVHDQVGPGHLPDAGGEADVVRVVVGEQDGDDVADLLADLGEGVIQGVPARRVVIGGIDEHQPVARLHGVHEDGSQRGAGQGNGQGVNALTEVGGRRQLLLPVKLCESAELRCRHPFGFPSMVDMNIPNGRN